MSETGSAAARTFARCRHCKVSVVLTTEQMATKVYQDDHVTVNDGVEAYHMPCFPANTLPMTLSGVKATFSPNTACDAKCTHATSPICKCSCGGVNHGSHA